MNLRAAIAFCLLLGATQAVAQTDPASAARRAAQQLDQASMALQDAESARDRVAALTRTIRAYEDGLAALREGLRRAAIREQSISRQLEAQREEIARLVGVLVTMQRAPEALLLLHPAGPTDTIRAAMLLGDITPALQAEADDLAARLREVEELHLLQQSAEETLGEGLAGVQQARIALSQAISERAELPRRYATDKAALLQLLESSDTLEGFASGLAELGPDPGSPVAPEFAELKGALPLPVAGTVLRRMGEADAAGIVRPGWLIATPPLALVTAPAAATVRYAGPLLDYGNVIILEPSQDTLLVLAGLLQIYAAEGDVLAPGAPLGLMGGADPSAQAILGDAGEGGGAERSETLYMELRQDNVPVDPAVWFNVRKE